MKLWISAELDEDVAKKYLVTRNAIQNAVNDTIKGHTFKSHLKSWDVISIVMSDIGFYEEITKKSKKDKSLEFRLRIDHDKFLKANQKKANQMLLQALGRAVDMMSELGVTDDDICFLKESLTKVAKAARSPKQARSLARR